MRRKQTLERTTLRWPSVLKDRATVICVRERISLQEFLISAAREFIEKDDRAIIDKSFAQVSEELTKSA